MTRIFLRYPLLLGLVSASGCRAQSDIRQTACDEVRMPGDDVQRFRETTNPQLSQRSVGIADIMERDLPDASGAVARRTSATLVIFDAATNESRHETVQKGSVVAIGADRYCIADIELVRDAPGWLSMQKLER
jgi:hypothetical protein